MGIFKHHQFKPQASMMTEAQSAYLSILFQSAKYEYLRLLPFIARYGISRLVRKPLDFNKVDFSDLMISIDPTQGNFLYQQVLIKQPNTIFEFGLSHGISAIYMALALEKCNQGQIYSTEIESKKVTVAQKHIDYFQLRHRIKIQAMDVLKAIDELPDNIEFVHMDGFPELNLAVFKKLEPKLAAGAVIITDDTTLFNLEMKDYLQYLQSSREYCTTLLQNSTGIMYGVKL